jgi:hypothetical protein
MSRSRLRNEGNVGGFESVVDVIYSSMSVTITVHEPVSERPIRQIVNGPVRAFV